MLDRFLFRHIAPTNMTGKIVSAVAVFVGLPELLAARLRQRDPVRAADAVPQPGQVYLHIFSTPINGLELETVIVTAAVVLVVSAVLRSPRLGLTIRAAVESPRLLELEGVRSDRVLSAAWMGSSLMAGLAGVLLAPQYPTVQSNDYAILLVAAMAAAALGTGRSARWRCVGGILLGVVDGLGSGYFPPSSVWHTGLLPAIPFLLLAVLLVGRGRLRSFEDSDDPLSAAIRRRRRRSRRPASRELDRVVRLGGRVLAVAAVVSVLTWVPGRLDLHPHERARLLDHLPLHHPRHRAWAASCRSARRPSPGSGRSSRPSWRSTTGSRSSSAPSSGRRRRWSSVRSAPCRRCGSAGFRSPCSPSRWRCWPTTSSSRTRGPAVRPGA